MKENTRWLLHLFSLSTKSVVDMVQTWLDALEQARQARVVLRSGPQGAQEWPSHGPPASSHSRRVSLT